MSKSILVGLLLLLTLSALGNIYLLFFKKESTKCERLSLNDVIIKAFPNSYSKIISAYSNKAAENDFLLTLRNEYTQFFKSYPEYAIFEIGEQEFIPGTYIHEKTMLFEYIMNVLKLDAIRSKDKNVSSLSDQDLYDWLITKYKILIVGPQRDSKVSESVINEFKQLRPNSPLIRQ